ncbi:MAG: DUF3368 domain-containing protein [Candidatus Aminicenantes bacterium]|nr:DUF3368 domain-containing protein [Candidatus Aminicenantes bacterium]NIM84922.1 DUF3368 domain-containing protein [Candidatus Aminicenantes bacterium]NIN24436.1 DUF3368 domain-containing protein [Candidatus Aminicenantes bacterium]NIN48200.1 DUF3368 domain-containing protein [Candidatus Aminicenantes bacterium]NIN91103.1 DUF3368 domain-containing protein [Candidatus Aminicenantes bacterium]
MIVVSDSSPLGKKKGNIKQVKPLLDKLIKNRIRIGISLYQKALDLAGES